MTERTSETVASILAAATAALPKRIVAEVGQVDAAALMAALAEPVDIPGVEDLGPFTINGQRPTDLLITRRLRIGGRVVRFLAWPED